MHADGGQRVETPPLPASGPIRSARPCWPPTAATPAPGDGRDRRRPDGVHRGLCPRPAPAARRPTAPRSAARLWIVKARPALAAVPVPRPGQQVRRPVRAPARQPAATTRCSSTAQPRATMFTWVGAQFSSILSTYVLGVVRALMAAHRADRADGDDAVGRALRLGRAAQRGVRDGAHLPLEGLQDRPGAGLRAAVGFYIGQRGRHRQRAGDGRGHHLPARRRRPGDRHVALRAARQVQRRRQRAGLGPHEGRRHHAAGPAAGRRGRSRSARWSSCASRCSSSRWPSCS